MKHNFTREELTRLVVESTSYRQVLLKLNMNESGGNYQTLKKRIREWALDCSHFTGKRQNRVPHNKTNLQDVLDGKVHLRSSYLKKRLISDGILENKCAECGIVSWRDKPLSFELDHINGDRQDNRLVNLRIVCPNCHSQTPTWRGRKPRSGGGTADTLA